LLDTLSFYRMAWIMRRRLALFLLVFAISACDRGDVVVYPLDTDAASGVSLTLHVRVDVTESEAADSLGWSDGVPGATVTIVRVLDFIGIDVFEAATDSSGNIRFDAIPEGSYWVAAVRYPPSSASISPVYAGGAKVNVAGPTVAELPVRADQPGSLVFSELALEEPPGWLTNGLWYHYHKFVELHNNSEETVYLDGMLLGKMYRWTRELSYYGHHSCAQTEPLRNDPEGIWANQFLRFPGSGTEFPVGPGETIVVAVSAADHRDIHHSMKDLSNADFETLSPIFGGDFALGDNPFAPNLLDVGLYPWLSGEWLSIYPHWFLTEPLDLSVLPRTMDPGGGLAPREYVRVPSQRIIDAVIVEMDYTEMYWTGIRPIHKCRDPVHETFYTVPGGFFNNQDYHISAQRRVARTLPGGRKVLLRTGVGLVDFFMAPATPAQLP
jgi:hypothetical protein